MNVKFVAYLFVYSLFNDNGGIWDYMAINVKLKNELEKSNRKKK
jgi:hypothetical protein